MKKKYSWLINVATICLCICAIAIGVYAASSASLKVSGSIGFTAHNCKVSVNGYIYGHGMKDGVDDIDGLPVAKPTTDSEKIKLSNTDLVIEGGVTSEENSKLNLGKRYFSDMESDDGKPNDIFVVIVVTNASPNFKVRATMDLSESATNFADGKIIATPYCNFSQVLDTTGTNQTAEFIYRLELQKTGDTYENLNADTTSISLKMSFEKYTIPTAEAYPHLTFASYNDTAQTVYVTGFDNSIDTVIIPFEIKKGDIVYSVTQIDNDAFYSKNKLVNISLPDTIIGIGEYSFFSCVNLSNINFPNFMTQIDDAAFYGCIRLVNAILPDSLKSINRNTFDNCTNLNYVKLPKNENFTRLEAGLFKNCISLTAISIPASVTYISDVFLGCTKLKEITCLATTPPNVIDETNLPGTNVVEKIYVPSASVEAYKAADIWKDYASIIEGI